MIIIFKVRENYLNWNKEILRKNKLVIWIDIQIADYLWRNDIRMVNQFLICNKDV